MTWLHLVMLAGVIVGTVTLISVWRLELRDGAPGSSGDDRRGRRHGVDHRRHDDDPAQGGRVTDRGAAMVELALAMPLLVLLIVGGIDITMAVQTRGELQHYAQQIAASDLHEDEAGNLADSIGATLECFSHGTDPACFPDGLDETVERRQVVLSRDHDGIVLPSFTVRGDGLGVVPSG